MKHRVSFILLLVIIASLMTASAFAAGDLVTGATIDKVVVRKVSPVEAFSVAVTGGSGPCANTTINFPSTGNASTDDGLRAVAIAAYLSGKPVKIHSYAAGTDCTKGEYIRME